MTFNKSPHTFHIPVMGTGYTIDSPIKVAHFGISSVISLADHKLIEQVHEHHALENNIAFKPIPKDDPGRRAKTITAYLNLVDHLVKQKTEQLQNAPFEKGSAINKYYEMLPSHSPLRKEYLEMLHLQGEAKMKKQSFLRQNIIPGSIDVNVMTKLDKVNYLKKEALPSEYNDAHAAVRGFANSNLHGAIVLSAGMNPRLFNYMSSFADFFPDENGYIKKRIILKVSDYRSAMIQGKFLAKKGLWVSEFRIESGLNCGGHAFATDGYLMGPILQEFKENREDLSQSLFEIYISALQADEKYIPETTPSTAITVQGGVGTVEEQQFLLEKYNVDSVGWGTPFLLVPEAVAIDNATMALLSRAKEKDLYLSSISPLGVPFNSVRNNTADIQRLKRIEQGKPGSPCIKEHLVSSTEFSDKALCTASNKYQKQKINELQHAGLEAEKLEQEIDAVTQKTCLCMGLANSALTSHSIPKHKSLNAVAVCPGPNMAYFFKIVSLKTMADHIYGRTNLISRNDRPHMFIKELSLYLEYYHAKLDELPTYSTDREKKYLENFRENLLSGIIYYQQTFSDDQDIQNTLIVAMHQLELITVD